MAGISNQEKEELIEALKEIDSDIRMARKYPNNYQHTTSAHTRLLEVMSLLEYDYYS